MSLLVTILVTLLVFGVLITVHEAGHYLVARVSGVAIIEFSIGMGPKIFSFQGRVNEFSVRALPIGGYVRMVGEPGEEDEDPAALAACIGRKAINEIRLWKRMLIVLAGPFMNVLLAFLIMLVLVSTGEGIASTRVACFEENSVSDGWLQEGDVILKFDGKTVRCWPDLSYQIMTAGPYEPDILVERNGEKILLEKVQFAHTTEQNVVVGVRDFKVYAKQKTFPTVLYEAFWQGCSTVYVTVDSLIDTFSGKYGVDAIGGPVAVGEQIGNAIQAEGTFADTLRNIGSMAMMISVSLGICNLLPIPALDGGRFLLYVIEGIRRKPLPKELENRIMTGCMLLLFALMILIFFKDLIHLF